METTKQQGAALGTASTTEPTAADFNRYLAEAVQQWGTVTLNGVIDYDETVITTLATVGDLGDYMPISANRLADLMDVVNEYAVTACTMDRQGKANRAHETLTRLISLYLNVTERRQELFSLASAASQFEADMTAYTLAQHHREQEAKATAKADEAAELRRRAELADLKRKAWKLGAAITFTEADAAATDEPEDATAPKEGAESHEPETMTDNTPKR